MISAYAGGVALGAGAPAALRGRLSNRTCHHAIAIATSGMIAK